jgi:phosphatidylinositol alpha-1,6-mannosyltransferase
VAYVVVGQGHDRARLEALAVQAVGAERVRFLGGVGLNRLVDAYRMADLFVLPSKGEGFGIAFIEAMASGTPVLGLSIAGAMDALADGELGTAVSETEFTATLARLLAAPKPNLRLITDSMHKRFGREAFVTGASAALNRLKEAN